MTTEGFADCFDRFVDVPKAMVKVRELVLELAFSGRLVDQREEDEPAEILVERIERHLAALRASQVLRGNPVEALEGDSLSRIPATWTWARLGNVVFYGSSEKSESVDIPNDAWLLDLEDLEKDSSRLLRRKTFSEAPSSSTKSAFAVGDVLYGKLRPYLNKVLVADAPGYCTTEIVPIRTFGFIEPNYLRYALKRPAFIAYANSKSYGMNLPRLGTDDARRAAIPIAPVPEQKRIVAKVDDLMALCDQLEAQQQERAKRQAELAQASLARFADAPTQANLNFLFHDSYDVSPADLSKSILNLAVRGRLVAPDTGDEPAADLLKRIKSKKIALGAESTKSGDTPIALETAPFELPVGWVWSRWESVALKIGDIDHMMPNSGDVGIPYVSPRDFLPGNRIDFEAAKRISFEDYTRLAAKIKPEVGDLIYPRYGTIGENRLVVDSREFLASYSCAVIKTMSGFIEPRYQYFFSVSDLCRAQAKAAENKTTQANVGIKSIKGFLMPVPPLAEQRRIVSKVDELMTLVEQLEDQLSVARKTGANLIEAVVAELVA